MCIRDRTRSSNPSEHPLTDVGRGLGAKRSGAAKHGQRPRVAQEGVGQGAWGDMGGLTGQHILKFFWQFPKQALT
eukprot:9854831-Alexandrium_andersonii.AAC.1